MRGTGWPHVVTLRDRRKINLRSIDIKKKGVYLHSIVWKSNQLFVHGAGVNQSEYTFELSFY